ncbi:hypothetical protein OsI_02261 [Oryza sativa Indica Group]|uniref:Uncharacterized protein n=1 Tax=Oryza sativa subsp. indica TaxID=39946 RepID=A2WQX8_ORYSI|nr:hypothetical protein OsI_02261 [Oryza sativa Indica Group]
MDESKEDEAIGELSQAIAFRADLQLLHLRAAFFDSMGDNANTLRDCEAALCLDPTHGSSSTYPNFSFGWINVKDVALAHILAYEVPSANGRYCMVERVVHYSELVQIIREMYPNIPLPDKCADDKPSVPIYQVSKEKIKSLGLELTPLHTSIKETIESLKEKGFVTFDSSNL